ncbi:MAG: DUF6719 family protein [Burkholderiales bacterium]
MTRSTVLFAKRIGAMLGLLVAAVLLSACGDMPMRPVDEKVATIAAGYGRAFGRIDYLENGKEKNWSGSVFGADLLTLFVRSVRSGEMQYMQIEGNGSFYWPLRAGDYEIVGYQVTRQMVTSARHTGRLMTTFSVSKPGQAVYIGDLRIEAGTDRYRFDVVDRYAEALKRVDARITAGRLEAVKDLMRLEKQAGSYKRVVEICDKAWALKCDRNYQGVEPVRPSGTEMGFPVTHNLTPLLEWKPSGRPEVSYDVAIYDAYSFAYGATGVVPRMSGALVDYSEGLREPRYSPPAPLQPGKKYEWTVRLRDGDTVSSWSATSYFVFAIVAWASGSGQGFGFATPATSGEQASVQYLKQDPPGGSLSYGQIVYVDDGSCPAGEVKEITGGSRQKSISRVARCVKRPRPSN